MRYTSGKMPAKGENIYTTKKKIWLICFLIYVLKPQETKRDRPQVVAERCGEFPCIENYADECLVFCQVFLEPSHMSEILLFDSRSGLDFNAKQGIVLPFY